MAVIQVRAREPRDVEALAAIFACPSVVAGTLQLPYQPSEVWRERLTQPSPDLHALVAELDGRVVGTLGLHLATNPRRRHTGTLGMAVHDDYQGRGVGSALLAAAIDLAERWLGLTRLELNVYTDNVAAIHLYEKLGFVIEGTSRRFALRDGVFVDAYTMARLRP